MRETMADARAKWPAMSTSRATICRTCSCDTARRVDYLTIDTSEGSELSFVERLSVGRVRRPRGPDRTARRARYKAQRGRESTNHGAHARQRLRAAEPLRRAAAGHLRPGLRAQARFRRGPAAGRQRAPASMPFGRCAATRCVGGLLARDELLRERRRVESPRHRRTTPHSRRELAPISAGPRGRRHLVPRAAPRASCGLPSRLGLCFALGHTSRTIRTGE